MSTSTIGLFIRHLALSEEVKRLKDSSDRDLLAAYQSERSEAAFTELMRRYESLVLRTCRRILGQGPDAEDAFQATFILLARKANQLAREAVGALALGGWLHRVAYQTALDARIGTARRKAREQQANVMAMRHPSCSDPAVQATWNEVQPILDAELNALPEEARRLLIACYLHGKSYSEAAAELGLPRSSLAWRLGRARTLLAARLARRGVTVSAALLVVLLEETAKGAGVSAVLRVHTLQAAMTFNGRAAGMVSAQVASLVKGALASMTKSSTYFGIVLAGWVVLLGAGLIACQTLKAWPNKAPESEPAAAQRPAREQDESIRTDRYGDPLPPGALARLGTMRLRHSTSLVWMAFTRDGKGLITAGSQDPLRLWDMASGRMLHPFGDSQHGVIYAGAISSDGRTLVGKVAATGDLCLWNVATGKLLRRLKGDQEETGYVPLAFSPDGKTMASVYVKTQTLYLREIATGKKLWDVKLLEHDPLSRLAAITYSEDGKTLIWASKGGAVHLCDAATGKELRRWDDEKKRYISALVCSPNGRLLTVHSSQGGATEGLVCLWDTATGKEVWQRASEERIITRAVFSPDGKILALGYLRGPIHLWDAATGKELRNCAGSLGARCLAFTPDGKILASGGEEGKGGPQDHMVHLWDVSSGREIHRADGGHQATVCSLAFTPDGKDVVSGGRDGSLRVWDASTGAQRQHLLPPGNEHFTGWLGMANLVSSDGKTITSAALERGESKTSLTVRRWEKETGRELRGWSQTVGNNAAIYSPIFSPDGKTVACMAWSVNAQLVYLWEAETGTELVRIPGGYPAFSPDGRLLATAPFRGQDGEGEFKLWETATGKKLCSIPVLGGTKHRLLFSPDGRMLATMSSGAGDRQSVIHLRPLLKDESQKSGVRIGSPRLLPGDVPPSWWGAWAFSPDGRTLALAGEGDTVRLLETVSGKERGCFAGHGGEVVALSFAPDSRRLVSSNRDTTILIWDVTGRLRNGGLRPARLPAKELEGCWDDLATSDTQRAGRALWTLAADPAQAVPFLAKRLHTAMADARSFRLTQLSKLPQLLRDLDDDVFAVRKKAKTELVRLGEAAEPALRQALSKSPSAETRRSVEEILKVLEEERQTPSGDSLRGLRAVEVLEHIGTHEARQALKALTAGAGAESSLTQEAHVALERLERAERR